VAIQAKRPNSIVKSITIRLLINGQAMDGAQLKAQYKTGERNFRGVALSGVNLVWVELKGVDLRGADLSHANLSGADLSGSDLSHDTNLAFTDLSRADLRNTNLKGARLEGANLEGVQLEGAVYDEKTKFPRGFDPQLVGGISGGSFSKKNQSQQVEPQQAEPQKSKPQKPKLRTKVKASEKFLQDELFTSNEALEQQDTDTQSEESKESSRSSRPYRYVKPTESEGRNISESIRKEFKHLFNGEIASAHDWQQTQPQDWAVEPAKPSDFSTNSSGQGKSSRVPVDIRGWNWGAFLLPWFWFIPNQVWGGILLWLLSPIPVWNIFFAVVFAVAFGRNGNAWAWKARPWDDVKTFKGQQRLWAVAGFLGWGLVIFVTLCLKFIKPSS
jgi:Pentapeptide repeats (8 copies)